MHILVNIQICSFYLKINFVISFERSIQFYSRIVSVKTWPESETIKLTESNPNRNEQILDPTQFGPDSESGQVQFTLPDTALYFIYNLTSRKYSSLVLRILNWIRNTSNKADRKSPISENPQQLVNNHPCTNM